MFFYRKFAPYWFGLVSLFIKQPSWVNILGFFNAQVILLEEQYWYYLTHSWEVKGVHSFPKGICPKVILIVQLEYELAYYNSAVHRFNHYTTRTPYTLLKKLLLCFFFVFSVFFNEKDFLKFNALLNSIIFFNCRKQISKIELVIF